MTSVTKEDISPELLLEVKNFIDVTWDDEAGDEKLKGTIAAAENWINDKTGAELDYSGWDSQKMLPLNYVMYSRAAALDDFYRNYRGDVMTLQTKEAVKRAKEQSGDV